MVENEGEGRDAGWTAQWPDVLAGYLPQRPSQLPTIEKKGAFLLPKIEFSPSNPTSEKIIASFKVLSWFDTIIHQKIEKVSQKKYFLNDFTSNHPIATQIPDLING